MTNRLILYKKYLSTSSGAFVIILALNLKLT
jgi:hypothetical protein